MLSARPVPSLSVWLSLNDLTDVWHLAPITTLIRRYTEFAVTIRIPATEAAEGVGELDTKVICSLTSHECSPSKLPLSDFDETF